MDGPVLPVVFLHRDFTLIEMIGSGQYGKVWRCESRETKDQFACKQMKKRGPSDRSNLSRHVDREIAALRLLDRCPSVVSIHGVYEDSSHIYLLLDLCEGGDLFSLIAETDGLPESQARELFASVSLAVQQCHDHGVLHRDLKPDNFLLCPIESAGAVKTQHGGCTIPPPLCTQDSLSCSSPSSGSSTCDHSILSSPHLSPACRPAIRSPPDSCTDAAHKPSEHELVPSSNSNHTTACCAPFPRFHVRLADFGLSLSLRAGERAQGYAGSYPYEAPEMLRGDLYSFPADVWSLGVVLFALLSANWPAFKGRHALDEASDWEGDTWGAVSEDAKNLIRRMLSEDPHQRPTIEEVLSDPWFNEHDASLPLPSNHSTDTVADTARGELDSGEMVDLSLGELKYAAAVDGGVRTGNNQAGVDEHAPRGKERAPSHGGKQSASQHPSGTTGGNSGGKQQAQRKGSLRGVFVNLVSQLWPSESGQVVTPQPVNSTPGNSSESPSLPVMPHQLPTSVSPKGSPEQPREAAAAAAAAAAALVASEAPVSMPTDTRSQPTCDMDILRSIEAQLSTFFSSRRGTTARGA